MRSSNENNQQILSLNAWPSKSIQNQMIKLSPKSAKILQDSGTSVKDILPASVHDYLGIKILNQQDLEQLLFQYTTFEQQRLEKLKKLKQERKQYDQIARQKNISRSDIQSEQELRIENNADNEKTKKKNCLAFYAASSTRLDFPKIHKNQNQISGIEMKLSCQRQMDENQHNLKNNRLKHHLSQNQLKCPRLTFYNKQQGSPSTTRKSRNIGREEYLDQMMILKDKNVINRKSVKWQPELTKTFENYQQYSSIKLHKIKSVDNIKHSIKIPHKKQKKSKHCKSKSKSKISSKNYSLSSNKSNKIKKSLSNSKDQFSSTRFSKNKNQFQPEIIQSHKLFMTQKPNSFPAQEYYNQATTKLPKKKKNTTINIHVDPIIDQLARAADDLMNLTQKQQIQIQMLQNLQSRNDKLSQKQKNRLIKIHRIERDQLKNRIGQMKDKIGVLKNKNIGVLSTL